MAHNSLAPGFIKLFYTVSGIQHTQVISVAEAGVAAVGDEPDFTPKTGSPVPMSTWASQYMTVYQPFHHTTTDINSVEYWRQTTPTSDPIWIYTHSLGVAGTSATAAILMSQWTMSFRTALGGLFKWTVMEPTGTIPVNTRLSYPFGAGIHTNMANYITGNTSCFLARDNASLVVPIFISTKTNDALRKRRLLF